MLLRAARAAAGRGVEVALVGGVVRNALLGRGSVDVDVAVPRGAVELARRVADRTGGAFVLLDEGRGTARVVLGGHRLDVADFRAPDLAGDLGARDFTVDALAVALRPLLRAGRAPIVDPLGGLRDLRARRLRLTGPGALADDPVRGLRGARLASSLGFGLARASARAIRAGASSLGRVAAERMRDELTAMLALPSSAGALRLADRLGLLEVVLPEIGPMRRTAQPAPHRFDVLEHSLRAVAGADRVLGQLGALAPFGEDLARHFSETLGGGIDRGQSLRLAALLHDVAKPQTRRRIAGRVRFFEHDVRGAARARAIGERLRLPERVTAVVERLVRHHLRPMHLGAAAAVTPRARYRFFRDLGAEARDLVVLALADAAAVTGASPLATWRRAALLRDLMAGWAEQREVAAAPPLVRGGDVMARYGLVPGPEVGRLLARAREAQALWRVRTREEALAYLDSVRAGS
ncbi:MAG: HDIG domain-containing protein [Candidatus Rokubacteria bacterium]|nr:HDIG domain-containing protein [Candidatus Rokubacteria bacterium]